MIDHMIGKELGGRYQIRKSLGQGGMAAVYVAQDNHLNREVAIKVILPGYDHSELFLKRFDREARSAARLTHPNVIKVIDYGVAEGLPYLVMEYVSEGSLKDRLGAAIPWKEAFRQLIPVARALAYAHSQGIVHRDLKPANILVTRSGDLVLTDFGIAKTLNAENLTQLTATGVSMGTPAYMAPEQGMGEKIDPRVDIYSFGVVLYEMITGRPPFEGETPVSVMMKHLIEPPPKPSRLVPDLPPAVEQALMKALEKKPEDRYQEMDDFVAILENLLRSSTVPLNQVGANDEKTFLVEPPNSQQDGKNDQKTALEELPNLRPDRKRVFLGVAVVMLCGLLLGGLYGLGSLAKNLLATEAPVALVDFPVETPTPALAGPGADTPTSTPPRPANTSPATLTETETSPPTAQAETAITLPPTDIPTPGRGSTMVSEIDGMRLVFIPAGEFLMGSSAEDALAEEDEKPQHIVYLDAYWIDQTEVTNAMFQRFVRESGHLTQAEEQGWSYVYNGSWQRVEGANWQHPGGPGSSLEGFEDYPVVHVSWADAQAYCRWAGRRLPTEAEWEKAARGTEGALYPGGNQISCNTAQYVVCEGQSLPVGSKPAGISPFGAFDMAGNVWEWVADWYDQAYYVGVRTLNPQGPDTGEMKVQRGGSWRLNEKYARSANRSPIDPKETWQSDGFRCALSP
jgi:serine/threonine protein kinase/formylglycine-generating enzyme required for sulfatase activity